MKITKSKLKKIIKEELQSVLKEMRQKLNEELIVGDIYRMAGTESSSSHEVKILNVFGKVVEVEIIGNGFSNKSPGDTVAIKKANFESGYTKRSMEDGKPVNTVSLTSTESPTDVLRSLGYISEGFKHHILTKKPLTENVYRIGSDAYFETFKEARVAYKKGIYNPLNEEEREALDSDLGEWVMFEGERVPLDFPMYVETLDEKKKRKKKKKNPPIGKPMKGSGGKKYQVYVKNKKTGRVKKISYGDSKGGLKGNWNNTEARSNFASRHNCAEKKDRTKAGYWACRAHKDFGTNVPGRFW